MRDVQDLRTERLTLVPLTPSLARVAIRDTAELGRLLGASVPRTWPGADFRRILPRIARSTGWAATADTGPAYFIVHAADGVLIGESGLHRPPDASGSVEVGYAIVPAYRGRGFALEATRAVVEHALARPDVRRVVAACLEDNAPSIRVLEKLGMRRVGRAGDELRFELRG